MVKRWEIEKAEQQDTNTLKNWIWAAVSTGQPIPGCISIDACRMELKSRGEDGRGYHNT